MTFELLWFCLIAVLWGGYFVLEGFDFGVGMLLPVLGRGDEERDVILESIEPVWDGNEVWLVVAAGATFAAFPVWYATMFSGFYLALLLILVCLIVRAVSFEWRHRSDSASWRRRWLTLTVVASFGAPFLWGIALANLLDGVPLDSNGDYAGNLTDLFSVYAVFTGLVVVVLFAFHGATYLTLRTSGELCERVARTARTLAVPAAVAVVAFAVWTVALAVDRNDKSVFPPIVPAVVAGGALLLAVVFVRSRRSGLAFTATAVGSVGMIATLFTSLYPRVIVSSPNFDNSLTVSNAASSHYALATITVVALVLTPIVLLYQGWTYYVFRARVGGDTVATRETVADVAPPDAAPRPGTPAA